VSRVAGVVEVLFIFLAVYSRYSYKKCHGQCVSRVAGIVEVCLFIFLTVHSRYNYKKCHGQCVSRVSVIVVEVFRLFVGLIDDNIQYSSL
jgi:hypothetical protein